MQYLLNFYLMGSKATFASVKSAKLPNVGEFVLLPEGQEYCVQQILHDLSKVHEFWNGPELEVLHVVYLSVTQA